MAKKKKVTCGLIMPISVIDGYSEEHWQDVKTIIKESMNSIDEFTFEVSMVSHSDDIGVIQKRIIQNIYNSDIVICDVSGKNPNVMFELGMRLAFDKPTVIIKDTKTGYSFDTGVIEHLDYPNDLRFNKIVNFKEKLATSVLATYKKSVDDPEHSTFLKSFGQFNIAKLSENVLPEDKIMISMMSDIQNEISKLRQSKHSNHSSKLEGFVGISVEKYFDAISRYINKYAIENFTDLLNDRNLYNYLEQYLRADRYYSLKDDFLVDADRAVNLFINRGDLIKK